MDRNSLNKRMVAIILSVSVISMSFGFFLNRYIPGKRFTIYENQIESGKKQLKSKQANIVHLNRYYHFTALMRDPSVECSLVRYRSTYDQTLQSILILKPVHKKYTRIFFFFHGMDGDCGDGVVVRRLVMDLNAKVICMGGRGPSWLSDAFLSDAEQVINSYSNDFQGYYMIGISMGGTQALALAGLLPYGLRQSVLGLISLIPGSDLPAIASESSNPGVRKTLMASVDSNLIMLSKRSPDQLINKYKKGLPFVLFYNEVDTLLLSEKLEEFIRKLQKKYPVSIFVSEGDHHFTYRNFDYRRIFYELGKNSPVKKRPPMIN